VNLIYDFNFKMHQDINNVVSHIFHIKVMKYNLNAKKKNLP